MAPALPPGRRWSYETLWILALKLPESACQLTREETLWVARTEDEEAHRILIQMYAVQRS